MTATEQIAKATGRSKARAAGLVPDQRKRRMRPRIVKEAISPAALAVHSPRMSAVRRRRIRNDAYLRAEAQRKAAWGTKKRPSLYARFKKWIRRILKRK